MKKYEVTQNGGESKNNDVKSIKYLIFRNSRSFFLNPFSWYTKKIRHVFSHDAILP